MEARASMNENTEPNSFRLAVAFGGPLFLVDNPVAERLVGEAQDPASGLMFVVDEYVWDGL